MPICRVPALMVGVVLPLVAPVRVRMSVPSLVKVKAPLIVLLSVRSPVPPILLLL